MNRLVLLPIALASAVPAIAQDQPAAGAAQTAPKLKTLLENCDAHKFETFVNSVVNGQPHRSKIKMCGVEGQTDAEWIGTLKDAIKKVENNSEMPASTREQIISAIKTEVARLENPASAGSPPQSLPEGRTLGTSTDSLSSDYSILPPLPRTTPPPPRVLPPADEPDSAAGNFVASATDSAPAPQQVPQPPAPIVRASPLPVPAKPRLTLSCISPEYPGGGECISISRDTILTVRAGEGLPAGVELRFMRRGEEHGVIDLGAMRSGRSVNYALPRETCSGVVSAEIEIAVVRNGQRVDRRGPYLLRC
jgi:hypothetical protein